MYDNPIQLDAERKDVILLLGITGVGKSTLAEILFGDLEALESTLDEENLCYKITNANSPLDGSTRGKSWLVSDTVCPQLFTDPSEPSIAIYDCPGFEDTRGTTNEFATGLYLEKLVGHADRIKLVVTVGYDAVQPNVDRKKFAEVVLPQVLDFVRNTKLFNGSVFLLVNKYENSAGDFPDHMIIRSIANFLTQVQEYAVTQWPDRILAIDSLFQQSWLRKSNKETYSNIGFFRKITKAGPLANIDSVTDAKDRIRAQLLDNLNFNFLPCDPEDFGFSLSKNAENQIQFVRWSLVGQTENVLKVLVEKLKAHFNKSRSDKLQLSLQTRCLAETLNDLKQVEGAEPRLSTKSLEILRQLSESIGFDAKAELESLEEIVKGLTYLGSVDETQAPLTWQETHKKMACALGNMERDVVQEARNVLLSHAEQVVDGLTVHVENRFLTYLSDKLELSRCLRAFANFLDHWDQLDYADRGLSLNSIGLLCCLSDKLGFENMKSEWTVLGDIAENVPFSPPKDIQDEASGALKSPASIVSRAIEKMEKDVRSSSGVVVMFPYALVCV